MINREECLFTSCQQAGLLKCHQKIHLIKTDKFYIYIPESTFCKTYSVMIQQQTSASHLKTVDCERVHSVKIRYSRVGMYKVIF